MCYRHLHSRMLKLPEDVRIRYDLRSLEVAIHAAEPCPVPVKEAMIDVEDLPIRISSRRAASRRHTAARP